MNGVNLIIATGAAKSIYVCYIMTALIQAFVFCYGGDSLEESVYIALFYLPQPRFSHIYFTQEQKPQH